MKINRPSGFYIYEYGNSVFFACMDLKQKWNVFDKCSPKKNIYLWVLRFTEKRGSIARKCPINKTISWKPIAQVVFISMNVVIQILGPMVGLFARMDLKQK